MRRSPRPQAALRSTRYSLRRDRAQGEGESEIHKTKPTDRATVHRNPEQYSPRHPTQLLRDLIHPESLRYNGAEPAGPGCVSPQAYAGTYIRGCGNRDRSSRLGIPLDISTIDAS